MAYAVILIVAASLLLFANTVTHPFLYDDHVLIVGNKKLGSPEYLSSIFNSSFQYDVPRLDYSAFQIDYYRPFIRLLFWCIYQVGGLNSKFWHLSNIILFSIVSVLVWALIYKLSNNLGLSTVSGLLFVVHPIHTEAVAYVNSLVETLHAIFFLSALLLYLGARETTSADRSRQIVLYLGALFLFEAALLTKEAALCFPMVIVALELSFCSGNWRECLVLVIKRTSLFLLPLAGYFALRYMTYGNLMRLRSGMPIWQVLINIPQAIFNYLKMLVYPVSLTMLNSIKIIDSIINPYFIIPSLLLLTVTLLLLIYSSRRTFFYWAFFIITLTPVLHLGIFSEDRMLQHRYAFLASVGFCALVGTLFDKLLAKSRVTYAVLSAVIIFLSIQTYKQNSYWRSEYVLYQREYALAPNSDFAACAYASQLLLAGQVQEAARLFTHVIEKIKPDSDFAHFGMASYYMMKGDYEQAAYFYERTIELQQGHRRDLYIYLAECYKRLGNRERAIQLLEELVKSNPDYLEAKFALAELMAADASFGGSYAN
ncbi:MAG: tetratricopeptide repeat protein [Acidobacteriota bacterium]|nr:tetratricopeptide repeat protein [Blastocatellia bacterium]MDW8413606.1 tetratricopeptide repeat protein [Acidobacteriota bacterium]